MILQFALVHMNMEYFTLSNCTLCNSNAYTEMITSLSSSIISTCIHYSVIRDRNKYNVNHIYPTALSILYNDTNSKKR